MRTKLLLILLSTVALSISQNIRISTFSSVPTCLSDSDCQQGYFCNSNFSCQDQCAMILCASGTICKKGQCHPMCNDMLPCLQGQLCTNGYCLDKCKIKDYCKSDQICQNGECKAMVTNTNQVCPEQQFCSGQRPDQTSCPTVQFIRKPDPIVCGVTMNGALVDYHVTCSACKDTNIIYYYNTACDKVPKDCLKSNITVRLLKSTDLTEIKCTNPRPTQKTCPTLYWIRQPDPLVCGINKHGDYVDFPVQCYACKDKAISFYYNKICAEVKKTAQVLTCQQVSCEPGYVCKEGKCMQSPSVKQIKCTAPRPTEKDCPTLNFIKQPPPLVCGVTDKGKYVNFPVQCYACKSTKIVYYYKTTCDQVSEAKCAAVQCKQGQKCIDGSFFPSKWPVCEKNTKKTQCTKNRPNEKTCPIIYFFTKPPNIVCGITSNKERISYPVQCYACKNKDVLYYYNKACQDLSQPCDNGTSNKCASDKDCKKGLSCEKKRCVDKCIATTCPIGKHCIKGKCTQPTLIKSRNCSQIKCIQGYKCQKGQCIDLCKDVFCIATHTCVAGKCQPIVVADCATIRCQQGYKCEYGQCVSLCKDILCIATHTCVNGQCVPIKV